MCKLLICLLLFWFGANADQYTNPIALASPDPWIQYYNGYYYLVATTQTNRSEVRKADKLAGLFDVESEVAYTFDGYSLWAPEIHLIDDRWYLFYSSCAFDKFMPPYCHRNHVARSATDDPMGPYTFMADLTDDDTMELDPSYIIINDKQYLLGSYKDDTIDDWTQKLYIRPMTNPYTPEDSKYFLSAPTYDWETVGDDGGINEGPEPLYHEDRVFIVYSASFCSSDSYTLGLLEFVGTDPLNSTHWHKYPDPVFQRSDENGAFGPGHNGFFKSPDGTEDWIVYHANLEATLGCGDQRSARAQKFTWGDDGLPDFGTPEAVEVEYDGPSGE